MKRMFLFAVATIVGAIAIPIGAAHADTATNCTIPRLPGSTIISPGANDCIVRYATESDALAVVTESRQLGLFVWYADGVIIPDGQGFVIRVSNYGVPDYFVRNFPHAFELFAAGGV